MMWKERLQGMVGRWQVAIPALVSLAVIGKLYRVPGVSMDGVTYLQIARNILHGRGLGWEALWASPLHSILMAGVSYLAGIRDLLACAAFVSSAMLFLLVIAVYYLALEAFDRRTALVAALLAAIFPHLLFIAFSPEGEITYTALLTLALLLFLRAVKRASLPLAVPAGIAFALAYLARSEGFLIMGLVLTASVAVQGRRCWRSPVLRLCAVVAVAFMLTASPYLLFLKQHYGAWVVSPKATYVLIWMKSRIYHDNDKGEIFNDELWGVNREGKLRWQEPSGIGDLVRYLASHPRKSLDVYLNNLAMEIPGRIPNNSGMERYPQLIPVYLALAALLAAVAGWGSQAREKRAVLLAPLLILLILPVFTNGWWKYMVPYLPIVLVLGVRGFWIAADWGAARIAAARPAPVAYGLMVVTVALLTLRFGLAMRPAPAPPPSSELSMRRSLGEEAKLAGEWGARRFGPGRNYMVPWSKIIYYLDGFWTAFPVAGYPEVLAFARRHGVDYVVMELPGEYDLREVENAPPGMAFADLYRSATSSYAVAFYRVLGR